MIFGVRIGNIERVSKIGRGLGFVPAVSQMSQCSQHRRSVNFFRNGADVRTKDAIEPHKNTVYSKTRQARTTGVGPLGLNAIVSLLGQFAIMPLKFG